jgi:murein DD-endopeptidase MepM/ murein hydrolase activator NlpD
MRLPLRQIDISQYFGLTAFAQKHKEWYKDGLHLGIDFRCKEGTTIYSPINGISRVYTTAAGGKSIEIVDGDHKIFCCHLSECLVKGDEVIKEGQPIAYSGSTGKYTTGPHLHLGYYRKGVAVDPSQYFDKLFSGEDIKGKDWEKSYCYHRYGRPRQYLAEFNMMFKNAWLSRNILKRKGRTTPTIEENNALVYGGWSFDEVMDDTMYQFWSNLKKDEYQKLCRQK